MLTTKSFLLSKATKKVITLKCSKLAVVNNFFGLDEIEMRKNFNQRHSMPAETLLNCFPGNNYLFKSNRTITKKSSVLVLLINLSFQNLNINNQNVTEPLVLLTKRSSKLRKHPNEISFPGGRMELNESPEETALRESNEEIVLDKNKVELWGQLQPNFITSSSYTNISACVGVLKDNNHIYNLQITEEVETIFLAPIKELLFSIKYTHFRFKNRKKALRSTNYTLPVFFTENFYVLANNMKRYQNRNSNYKIWGVSALILHETLCSLLNNKNLIELNL